MTQQKDPTAPASSMVFTLEDDNHNAPVYETRTQEWETAPHDWEEPEEEAAEESKDVLEEALAAFRQPETAAPAVLPEPAVSEPPADKPAAEEAEAAQPETLPPAVADTADADNVPSGNDEPVQEAAAETDAEAAEKVKAEPEFTLPEVEADGSAPVRDTAAEVGITAVSAAEARLLAYRAAVTDDDGADVQPTAADAVSTEPEQPPASPASEEEAAYAHARFLRHTVAEHNATVFSGGLDGDNSETPEEDAAVLIQEDWIAAQEALKRERGDDDYLLPVQTVKLASAHLQGEQGEVPQRDITVHVYDVSDLPVGRKVRVVSEAALLADIRDKLRPHLSNAVAGLAARIVQKKTALLSYELQMMLNEEVPEVVEEILSHNLAQIFQAVKDAQK
ncbi:MAG: hypothetical protein Q4E77_06390 [Conchiformibius sp.]|nr:hypothetical protein [Conchiformibius sp.]